MPVKLRSSEHTGIVGIRLSLHWKPIENYCKCPLKQPG